MSKQIIIPFGPQHPVLPEPIHLDLVLEDEKVVDAIPTIGYVHRGLEKLVEKREFPEYVFIAERICGICSFIHSQTYVQGIEQIMGLEVPERAQFLRTIWGEYSRMHSHLLWLGLFAYSMGFQSVFMNAWRLREHLLDDMEATTGGRVIQGGCKVGGVRKDIAPEKLDEMLKGLKTLEHELRDLLNVFLYDSSIKYRLKGLGKLSSEDAYYLGAVGPVGRGSGIDIDMRSTGYGAFDRINFKPVVEHDGDCYARCAVRAKELFTSIDIIEQCIKKMPEGPVDTKFTGAPDGEYFSRAEQPRGEVVHYIKGNGKRNILRHRVRTPTFTNIPPLVTLLKGVELADVPVVVLTIDPCIGCSER
jgi:Ni,Fe-hydrogenase III large subunit